MSWERSAGPFFGNTIATLDITGRQAQSVFEQPVSASALVYLAAAVVPGPTEVQTIEVSREHSTGYGPQAFDISVNGPAPKGLYPGVTRDMKLMLRNPYAFPLLVKSLRGELVASSRNRCKPVAANLAPGTYRGRLPLVVPAKGKVSAGVVPLHMPATASAACQGAKFTIRLSGTATKAVR